VAREVMLCLSWVCVFGVFQVGFFIACASLIKMVVTDSVQTMKMYKSN